MTQSKTSFAESLNRNSLVKGIFIGAGIGLLVILFFITGADTQPHWPDLWKIRPLIITPLAGAMGGAFFCFSNYLLRRKGLNSLAALLISMIGFVVALWLGIVLGLDGTLWD